MDDKRNINKEKPGIGFTQASPSFPLWFNFSFSSIAGVALAPPAREHRPAEWVGDDDAGAWFKSGGCFPSKVRRWAVSLVPFGDINTREVQKRILGLVDLQAALLKETSLASFVSGFQLAHGITGELTSYCFARGEEDRAEEGRDRCGEAEGKR